MICHCLKAYKVFFSRPNTCIGILLNALDGFLNLKTPEHKDFCIVVLMIQHHNGCNPLILKVSYFIDTFILLTIMVDNNTLFHFFFIDFLLAIHY
jgi:hypothetical protein